MTGSDWLICEPSAHARALAGLDLVADAAPALRVLPAAERVVVVSRSRQPEREVFLDRCAADRVPIIIRPSGGGAVVLAPGTLTVSVIAPTLGHSASPEREFRRFCTRLAEALGACGVRCVVTRGVSDLCIGDRKIAGTSLRLWRGLVLFQASVLVDMDLDLLEHYLPMPSRQPEYRRGRGHRAFVTSLREAGKAVSEADLASALVQVLGPELAAC